MSSWLKRRKEREEERKKSWNDYRRELKKMKSEVDEHVLTISAGDYLSRNGKKLSDYELANVDATSPNWHWPNWDELTIEEALSEARNVLYKRAKKLNAEVVTDVKLSKSSGLIYFAGTALIPKENE